MCWFQLTKCQDFLLFFDVNESLGFKLLVFQRLEGITFHSGKL